MLLAVVSTPAIENMQSTCLPELDGVTAKNQAHGQYVDAQTQRLMSDSGPRTYPSVTLTGHAHAILGDVNINASSLSYLQTVNPADQKWLLLRSLYFENMGARKAQIQARAASPKYVEWVWSTNFLPWLEGPDTLYWVTGKAGSGKSTLMMHISDSARTKEALQKNGISWKITRFFFDFRAGTSLANTTHGLLRSLLYQTVQQIPEVVQFLDHGLFNGSNQSWTFQDCLDNLCEAINASTYRICAFIDGLDEFEGSYSDLIGVIQTLQERTGHVAGIKLCLASRPYPPFQENLSKFKHLTMQNHNDASIEMYTSSQWSDHRIDHRGQLPQDLCTRIRMKANGVFLWARLAVDELLVDFLARKPLKTLYEQLDSMPEEVESMYQRCLDRLPESQQHEAAAILYILLQSEHGRMSIDKLYAALKGLQSLGYVGQKILPVDNDADNRHRLLAILGDLTDQQEQERTFEGMPRLTVQEGAVRYTQNPEHVATLTHETMRAFLEKSDWFTQILSPELFRNNSHQFWTHLYLSEITLRILSQPKDVSLKLRVQESATRVPDDIRRVLRSEVNQNHVSSSDLAKLERELCDVCAEALEFLNEWKNWSFLLLFALGDVWDHISKLPQDPSALTHRIAPLINSTVFSLHISICTINDFLKHVERSPDKTIYVLQHEAECVNCAYLTLYLPKNWWSSNHEVLVMAAHGLGGLVISLLNRGSLSSCEKQLMFEIFFTCFHDPGIYKQREQIHESLMLTLNHLLDIGCELTGRNLCRLYVAAEFYSRGQTLDFIPRNLSHDNLSHDPSCDNYSSGNDMLAHLRDFLGEQRRFWNPKCLAMILTTLVDRGADFYDYLEEEGENFFVNQIDQMTVYYRAFQLEVDIEEDWVLLKSILDAGCDPYTKGDKGNTFEYISTRIASTEEVLKEDKAIEFLREVEKKLYAYVEEKRQANVNQSSPRVI